MIVTAFITEEIFRGRSLSLGDDAGEFPLTLLFPTL